MFIFSIISIVLSISVFIFSILTVKNKANYDDVKTEDACDKVILDCSFECKGDKKCLSKCPCGAWESPLCLKGKVNDEGTTCTSEGDNTAKAQFIVTSILFVASIILLIIGLVQKFA